MAGVTKWRKDVRDLKLHQLLLPKSQSHLSHTENCNFLYLLTSVQLATVSFHLVCVDNEQQFSTVLSARNLLENGLFRL